MHWRIAKRLQIPVASNSLLTIPMRQTKKNACHVPMENDIIRLAHKEVGKMIKKAAEFKT